MKPMSTGIVPPIVATSTVSAWPPMCDPASSTTTSAVSRSVQAAPSPAIPDPTTTTLFMILSSAGSSVRLPGVRSRKPAGPRSCVDAASQCPMEAITIVDAQSRETLFP